MKIISLEAENVKRINAVHIEPDGSMVVVGGNNGQGKTSVLDSIMYALGGGSTIPGKPIREGEKEAKITLDLGDHIIIRKITEKGTTLMIKNKKGTKFTSPQKMLDDLVGSLSFDPLDFSRMKPGEQLQILQDFCDFDFEANEEQYNEAYQKRTENNRQLKQVEARVDGSEWHKDLPAESIDPAKLYQEIEEAKAHNNILDEIVEQIHSFNTNISERNRLIGLEKIRIQEANERIAYDEKEISELTAKAKHSQQKKEEFHTIDIDPMVTQHHQAMEINQKIEENKERDRDVQLVKDFQRMSDGLTEKLEAIKKAKTEAVSAASLPVDGLAFDATGVSIGSIPFDQCSGAEQLRVSVAVGLALNPKLKILLVRDGSLLDKESLENVAKMVEDADAQMWIERVGKEGDPTVIIEDGAVLSEVVA